ncbi:hypothetical protein J5N97_023604 [Dioscorea zingiberensis]|uniref:CCHC-type domain-containing protein n=1 Tax=Dioscorea zingiberensis TaxID=325984 RepID=A0A9D5C636_9LILI|nr:hypothetical protein J5N97_023604 [Dioscorea zingiberensis]
MDCREVSDKEPWTEVHSKRRRRLTPVREGTKPCTSRGNHVRQRRSPPMKRTLRGLIEVCGRCRQPGHVMKDCRRLEVCRRCEIPGHRQSGCPETSPERGWSQRSSEGQPCKHKGKVPVQEGDANGNLNRPKEGQKGRGAASRRTSPEQGWIQRYGLEQQRNQKGKAPEQGGEGNSTRNRSEGGREGGEISRRKASPEPDTHFVSLTIDNLILAGEAKLQGYTIATIVKVNEGLADRWTVPAALAAKFAPAAPWLAEPLDDGRLFIKCPSPETAREVEQLGDISFPAFTARFAPWTADLDLPEKADGELRWLAGKGLPLSCKNRDTLARILKPAGDLVDLDTRGAPFANHFRAAVRVRRGQRLPCYIKCNIGTHKNTVVLGLEQGQPPLPLDPDTTRSGEIAGEEKTTTRRITHLNRRIRRVAEQRAGSRGQRDTQTAKT